MSLARNGISMSYSASSSSLPIVINTRPIERSALLTHHLQAAGFTVVDIPLLALQLRQISKIDIGLMCDWLTGGYKALVVISPTAAISGLRMWKALEEESLMADNNKLLSATLKARVNNESDSMIIAVGNATAATLLKDTRVKSHNHRVVQPIIASNEGMLVMKEIEQLKAGDKLLVWRGLGGRRLLVNTLKARGVCIDSIAWYENTMQCNALISYQQWLQQFNKPFIVSAAQSKPIVIISSREAFNHWITIVNQPILFDSDIKVVPLKLADFNYVVLGSRLAKIVAEQQLGYWRVESLEPKTILDAIYS